MGDVEENSFVKGYLVRRLFGLLLVGVLIQGCAKNDNPVDLSSVPPLPIVVFVGPITSSTHVEVAAIRTYVSQFNEFTTSFDAFATTVPTISDSVYTWDISGTLAFRLTATKQPDGGFRWRLFLNGSYAGVTYNNWLAYEGTTDAAQKNASWILYEDNKSTKNGDFTWTISSAGSLVGALKTYTNGVQTSRATITNNSGFTGEVNSFQNSVLTYHAFWLSSGSGQYWHYDANGQVTSQGTW
jgi:hypothetical protein